MLKRDRNLVEIAGGTFVYRVRITKNSRKVGNIKAYGAEMSIARHHCREPTLTAKGTFHRDERNFKIVFLAEQTRGMVGNYVYHIKVTTPTGQEIVSNIGHLNVIPFVKRGSYSDVDWGNANLVILDRIPTETDVADGDENTLYVVFGGGKEPGSLTQKREPWGDSNVALLARKPSAKDVVNGNSDSLYVIYATDNSSPSVTGIDWTDIKLQILAGVPTEKQVDEAAENTLFLVYDLNDRTAEWGSQ
jgi:hypothetical protein